MYTRLNLLNGMGDTEFRWDHADPKQVAEARATIADLAAKGYRFFLVDGTPADAVTAGAGVLNAVKIAPEEILPPGVAGLAPEEIPLDISRDSGALSIKQLVTAWIADQTGEFTTRDLIAGVRRQRPGCKESTLRVEISAAKQAKLIARVGTERYKPLRPATANPNADPSATAEQVVVATVPVRGG